ncbi:MAG TPA: alpha/beta fold hydrolase, partial [Geobacteraceae bacterium]
FGAPIRIRECLECSPVEQDIFAPKRIDFEDHIASRGKMRRLSVDLMQRYMAAIYGMTTVNHDHLFASMLKAFPFPRLNEENLRRRVFLAASENLEQMGVHIHRSLRTSQVSLLTDDRFNKYRDFITLAIDKGIVRREGEDLVKDAAKFASPFDFNRARIDHPVAVIANEVIPLTALQRKIQAIAWLTPLQLRHRIADYLIRKGEADFAADYATFFEKSRTKPREVGAPFLVKGRGRELGVVLIHGFLAAPAEVRELADYLGRQGIWVYAPRLKGHGTAPADLATRTHQDWIEAVDEGYGVMSNICRRVVVGGFSFGGGLALDLAARFPKVAGAFAVSPPLRLLDISSRFAPAVDIWNRLMSLTHYDLARKEFVEITPEHPQINYAHLPVAAIREMERFMTGLEPRLAAVQAPTLVVQGTGDPVVDPDGSRRLFNRLGAKQKEYLLFDFDRHGIIMGEGAQRVHTAIAEFLGRVRTESQGKGWP